MNYGKLLDPVNFFMVSQHAELAKKNGVTINDTKRTDWYTYGQFTCGAIYWVGKERARFKGIFVHPKHRGKGWGNLFTKGLLQRALEGGATTIEAHVFSTKWYTEHGFIVEKKFKTKGSDGRDFWKVVKCYRR